MTALRQDAEAAAGGLLALHKRDDEFLLIADDLYRKFEAATALLGAEHDEPVENVAKHFLTLRDDERAGGSMTPSSGCAQIVPRLSMSGSLNASASGGLSRGFPSLEAHTTRIASRTARPSLRSKPTRTGSRSRRGLRTGRPIPRACSDAVHRPQSSEITTKGNGRCLHLN